MPVLPMRVNSDFCKWDSLIGCRVVSVLFLCIIQVALKPVVKSKLEMFLSVEPAESRDASPFF